MYIFNNILLITNADFASYKDNIPLIKDIAEKVLRKPEREAENLFKWFTESETNLDKNHILLKCTTNQMEIRIWLRDIGWMLSLDHSLAFVDLYGCAIANLLTK